MKKTALLAAAALSVGLIGVPFTRAEDGEVHLLPVRGNVYMVVTGSTNVALSVGADGALLVDSGSAETSEKLLTAIQQLLNSVGASPAPVRLCIGCAGVVSPLLHEVTDSLAAARPIRYIINTSAAPDHTGGNARIAEAGRTVTGGDIAEEVLGDEAAAVATVVGHENVLIRLSESVEGKASLPSSALPSEVYSRDVYKLTGYFNGEGMQATYQPAAITDGDSIVHFRYSDVIVAGDIFTTTNYPMIDLGRGGSIQGVIDGLNKILDISIPEARAQGGTMIIPGHGRLSDSSDVAYYRDMVTIIRDRIQRMLQKGMTMEQVKAAKPTVDYDPRYSIGSWTGDMFVEAIYKSLSNQ